MVWNVFELLGGIAVFLSGLKFLAENFYDVLGGGIKQKIRRVTKSKCLGVLVGAGTTALMQSSVAVNMMVVSLAENSVISLSSACAVIIGTNIGTTVTAQIVSLTATEGFIVTAIGSLICFVGFCLMQTNNLKTRAAGKMLFGFGLVFIGVNIMQGVCENFYDETWFKNFFLIKSPSISLLNGFFITAACQSSSVVISMLVILSAKETVKISTAVYMILGANIGSSVAVILASGKMSVFGKRAAYFNFVFNLIGAAVMFAIMLLFEKPIENLFIATSYSSSGAVANFHTFFNVASGVLCIPFLDLLSKLLQKVVPCSISGLKRKAVR